MVRRLPGTHAVYELIASAPVNTQGRAGQWLVNLEAIDPLASPTETVIPIRPRAIGSTEIGWLTGCRYQWIEQGIHAGMRPGTQVDLPVKNQGIAVWIALEVWEDRSFGVYDVAQLRPARL